jgi:hypothetical protein
MVNKAPPLYPMRMYSPRWRHITPARILLVGYWRMQRHWKRDEKKVTFYAAISVCSVTQVRTLNSGVRRCYLWILRKYLLFTICHKHFFCSHQISTFSILCKEYYYTVKCGYIFETPCTLILPSFFALLFPTCFSQCWVIIREGISFERGK